MIPLRKEDVTSSSNSYQVCAYSHYLIRPVERRNSDRLQGFPCLKPDSRLQFRIRALRKLSGRLLEGGERHPASLCQQAQVRIATERSLLRRLCCQALLMTRCTGFAADCASLAACFCNVLLITSEKVPVSPMKRLSS